MSQWNPCKRNEFIRWMRRLGLTARIPVRSFLVFGQNRLTVPSNAEYSGPQLKMMLREATEILGRDITVDEWTNLK